MKQYFEEIYDARRVVASMLKTSAINVQIEAEPIEGDKAYLQLTVDVIREGGMFGPVKMRVAREGIAKPHVQEAIGREVMRRLAEANSITR